MSAILEIKDGVAIGPIHQPAREKTWQMGNNASSTVVFDPDSSPLKWPTICGMEGYVYDRAGLLEFQPELSDCLRCAAAKKATGRGVYDHEARLARNRARDQKRRAA